jgi:hypothetical protein
MFYPITHYTAEKVKEKMKDAEDLLEEKEARKQVYMKAEVYEQLEELAKNKNMSMDQYVEFLCRPATVFVSEPEPDPSVEAQLTPEQYAKLRKWLDNGDPVEVGTGKGNEAILVNDRELWMKNHSNWKEKNLGYLVNVRVTILSDFIDFAKQYLKFFSAPESPETLEDFCRDAIYDKVRAVHGDLTRFAEDPKHLVDAKAWFFKFPTQIHESTENESKEDC